MSNAIPAAATGLPTRRRALAALAGAGAALGLQKAVQAVSGSDARLLALGAELDRQEAAIKPLRVSYARPDATPAENAAYEAADDTTHDLKRLILAEPATTIEGFAVKVRAVAYIYHDDFTREALFDDGASTDQCLMWSVLSGLLVATGSSHLIGGAV